MRVMKLVLLAGAMTAGYSAFAQAADITPPVVEDQQAQYEAMGLYVRGDIGWSFLQWSGGDDDSAFAAGGGIGYRFNEHLRTDLRVDWSDKYDIGDNADFGLTTVTGNFYFDIPTQTIFTPYVGAGAGWGWASGKGDGPDDDGFAYALMAGATIDLSDRVKLDVGYRFRDTMIKGPDPYEHQILTGLRLEF